MITVCRGNLLQAEADALVNTVNTVGIMGKGIALQFKRAYPGLFTEYARACAAGEVRLGQMHIHDLGGLAGTPRWIINFPTKGHWRDQSQLTDIQTGLTNLIRAVHSLSIRSIAIPALGCGLGGLNWSTVRNQIDAAFRELPEVKVLLYPPQTKSQSIQN